MNQLFANPVVAGVIAVMISGAVMYTFKSLPIKLARFLWMRFTITLTVTGDDLAFDWINSWLSNTKHFSDKARTLKLFSAIRPNQIGSDKLSFGGMAPGFGEHVFWEGITPILISRMQSQNVSSENGNRPREIISITTIGRDKKRILQIFNKIKQEIEANDKINVYTCTEWGDWQAGYPKDKRDVSSIFLPQSLKTEILDHAKWFSGNRAWYQKRGVPYKLGYLLYGPPGTGKSSIVLALAAHLNKSIYALNPAAVNNESSLTKALNYVPGGSIVLIEDIDIASRSFGLKDQDTETKTGKTFVSMSCLLNCIDGVASTEDRILIMTTNNLDKLNGALIRPGRIDKKFEIGLMQPSEVEEMTKAFFPDNLDKIVQMKERATTESLKSGAEWQQELIDVKE